MKREFTVPGDPVAWQRGIPRVYGKFARVVNPTKMEKYKDHVRNYAVLHRPPNLPTGAVILTLAFYLNKPKTAKRKHHTVRPDVTNLTKNIEDAMTGSMYKDDSQIIYVNTGKFYAEPNTRPRVWIRLDYMEDTDGKHT